MIDPEQADSLIGVIVHGADGKRIGTITQVFLHEQNGQPEWVSVRTGHLRVGESLVPLAEAAGSDSDLTVPYDKATVQGAPPVGSDDGDLSSREEADLYRYYDLRHTDSQCYRGHGHLRATRPDRSAGTAWTRLVARRPTVR